MSRNEESEAVEAMLLLGKNKKEEKNEEDAEVLAVLKGKDWEKNIYTTKFEIVEDETKLVFLFDSIERIWSLKVIEGVCYVNEKMLNIETMVILNDGCVIDIIYYRFYFFHAIRPKKIPKSYQMLIKEAIESNINNKMTLAQIYDYFINKAGFDINDAVTWKNSIRHNLSLNKMFLKVPRGENDPPGKGSFWMVDKNYKKEFSYINEYDKTMANEANFLNTNSINIKKENPDQFKNIIFKDEFNFNDKPNTKKHYSPGKKAVYKKNIPRGKEKNYFQNESENYTGKDEPKNIFSTEISVSSKITDSTKSLYQYLLVNKKKRKCTYSDDKITKKIRLNYLENECINENNGIIKTDEKYANFNILNELDIIDFSVDDEASKRGRSMSIIELSEEFETMSLHHSKSKKSNKRKKFD